MNGKPQTLDGTADLNLQLSQTDDNVHTLWDIKSTFKKIQKKHDSHFDTEVATTTTKKRSVSGTTCGMQWSYNHLVFEVFEQILMVGRD